MLLIENASFLVERFELLLEKFTGIALSFAFEFFFIF
jgi:hypothetical protein